MKIYTKKGDTGETSLLGGTRVSKAHIRIEAYGAVDELNAHIGLLAASTDWADTGGLLAEIQDRLFTLGSHLAADPDKPKPTIPELHEDDVAALERSIDALETELPPLRNFVLPGGCVLNAQAHIARGVCRRAERAVVALDAHAPVEALVIQYLNRLSDWLFTFSRIASVRLDAPEVPWRPRG